MAFKKVEEIFGKWLDGCFSKALLNGEVLACNVDSETRVLSAAVNFNQFVSHIELNNFRNTLKKALNLSGIKTQSKFNKETFNVIAAKDICEEIKLKNVIINGYFNDAEFKIEGTS